MKTFIKNEEGVCPVCGADEVDYGALDITDYGVYYPWECPACGATGEEHSKVVFVTHLNVKTEDNEKVMSEEECEQYKRSKENNYDTDV